MRESRPPGSVRGVLSNGHPYRDRPEGASSVSQLPRCTFLKTNRVLTVINKCIALNAPIENLGQCWEKRTLGHLIRTSFQYRKSGRPNLANDSSVQLGVLVFGLPQNRDIRIGVAP